ncbi:Type 1 glutamine amidotransferase-like domain-containing protein [Antrihabitans stalactiti]|uniref:Peptidase n=1 Tax=Antrihabitans stalactiti TaxID=2584121 RepID=A0A848KPJ2_9NOCA|nr:peptidase [Antrihabitans stalactiti]
MRLFLSSYRFGQHADRLLALVGKPGPVAVIANAADSWPRSARESTVTSDIAPLRRLGFTPSELDLRDFVGTPDALRTALSKFPLVWVRGGNTFVLRAQFARSGADVVLPELVKSGALTYAGYSAGACVMTPSLQGIELFDDPAEVAPTCGIDARWDGLGLVDHAILPHWDSPMGDSALSQRAIECFEIAEMSYWTLTDDQAIVVDGERVERL